jgi:hypothetical protein
LEFAQPIPSKKPNTTHQSVELLPEREREREREREIVCVCVCFGEMDKKDDEKKLPC